MDPKNFSFLIMNIADEMDNRIDKFIADNKLPESLRVQFRTAAWIGASIANEIRMEEDLDELGRIYCDLPMNGDD